mmetsp:Transcript_30339/g.93900  ORF Transcript_30339/g.93900 Transcript_30339/m.93900 type:complete len:162 (+) Transcript_30339:1094-1579(+)
MERICQMLPNLTKLDITYGVKKIGMRYDRMLFGMKISDANSLAKSILECDYLTTLMLQSNLIDDDLLRMLMMGLIKNSQITNLDLSHNKITNHGVRLLSKLLGARNVLTNLNLADNQIHTEVVPTYLHNQVTSFAGWEVPGSSAQRKRFTPQCQSSLESPQ